jgi:carboxypeptidase T
LRAQGFTVLIDHVLDTAQHGPFTYYGGYHTVAEHYQHMDDVATIHPGLALTVTYGISWRRAQSSTAGYDLRAICITKRAPGDCGLNPNTNKPRFLMMAAIHARELTTAELAWRWIDLLVNHYGVDPDVTTLLDYNELWIVPVANPDGRAIVEEGGNAPYLQRKNANRSNGACADPPLAGNQYGVDLNRNASFQWDNSLNVPCSETYSGTGPASEPEESALENLMRALFHDQRGPLITDTAPLTTNGIMLTLHSYSDLVLLPWGWTQCNYFQLCPPDKRAPNDTGLRALAFRMSYFNGYTTGQPSEVLYAARGTTDDWAYAELGIPGFTFEVGPGSGNCTDFRPAYSCQDSLFWSLNRGAFLYAAKVARQPYALALGPSALVSGSMLIATGPTATLALTAVIASDVYGSVGVGRPLARPVSAAEYTIDTPSWVAGNTPISMTPQDGAFDSTTETATAKIDAGLSPGRHTLFIRGRDVDGNWGPVTAQWLFVSKYTLRLITVYRN